MENTFKKIEMTDEGINVHFETFGVFIPFETAEPTWDKAKEIAAGRGHVLPTVDEGFSIIEYTDEINKALKAAGKTAFTTWFWLDREHPLRKSSALCVLMSNGSMYCYAKLTTTSVCAVSAFHFE